MKSFIIYAALFLVTVFVLSCEQQEDYRKIRTQVVRLHDKVMQDADLAHGQYKALDSIYRSTPAKDSIRLRRVMVNIEKANHEMEEWMDHFEPDVSGKDAAESIRYFKAELEKINKLDLQYKKVIIDSDHYLDSLHRMR